MVKDWLPKGAVESPSLEDSRRSVDSSTKTFQLKGRQEDSVLPYKDQTVAEENRKGSNQQHLFPKQKNTSYCRYKE